jgi:hypothetical protein
MLLGAELRQVQGLAQRIWREAPHHLDLTIGELAYQGGLGVSNAEHISRHRLWVEAGRCRGWARFLAPNTLEWAVEPESPPLLDEILDWCRRGLRDQEGHGHALGLKWLTCSSPRSSRRPRAWPVQCSQV